MRSKILYSIVLVAVIQPGLAQVLPQGVSPGQIERQFERPPEARSVDDQIVLKMPSQEPPGNAADTMITVRNITIVGASVYSLDELVQLSSSIEGSTVPLTRIYDIANSITAKYRNDGYVLSRAIVTEQRFDKDAADINILVVEGYVTAVEFQGANKGRGNLIRKMADEVSAEKPHKQKTLKNQTPELITPGFLMNLPLATAQTTAQQERQ
jgi:hemolysin activation/secretion protein